MKTINTILITVLVMCLIGTFFVISSKDYEDQLLDEKIKNELMDDENNKSTYEDFITDYDPKRKFYGYERYFDEHDDSINDTIYYQLDDGELVKIEMPDFYYKCYVFVKHGIGPCYSWSKSNLDKYYDESKLSFTMFLLYSK